MALDVSFLDLDEETQNFVSIGMLEHEDLVKIATDHPVPLILRMSDYYGDARFEPSEISKLESELRHLAESPDCPAKLQGTISALLDLCRSAIDAGKGLEALAD